MKENLLSKTNDLTRFAALTNAEMPKKSLSRILLVPERWPLPITHVCFCPHSDRSSAGPTSPFYVFHIFRRRRRKEASDKSSPRRASEGQRVASFKFKRCLERHVLLELHKHFRGHATASSMTSCLSHCNLDVRYDVGVGLGVGHTKCLSFYQPP